MYANITTLQTSFTVSPVPVGIYLLEIHPCFILLDTEILILLPGIKLLLCLK